MPITVTIHALERMVTGIASENLTVADLASFSQQIRDARVQHYRKLLDVTHCVPAFSEKELAAYAQVLRTANSSDPLGPVAIVADPKRGEAAHAFAALVRSGPAAQVFRDIHSARRWLFSI